MRLTVSCLFLGITPPSFGGCKWRFKIIGIPFWRKPEITFGAVIIKPTGRKKSTITRHGATVMITAFNFIERVALAGVIAVVNGFGQHQRFFYHPLCHHVRGYLVLESTHALAEISDLPGFRFAVR